MRRLHTTVSCLLVAVSATGITQQPPSDQRFRTTTTGVIVDVVVRDKQGRPVTDLRDSDFELYEDGVRQDIASVTVIAPPAADAAAAAVDEASVGRKDTGGRPEGSRAIEALTFVALIFDRLSPEGRALAHNAAQAYLESTRADDFAGIFVSDLHLETIQTYTNDRVRLREAINKAASRATGPATSDPARVGGTALGVPNPAVPPTASAESHGPTGRTAAAQGRQNIPDTLLRQMAERMERTYEALTRDQQGIATVNALLAVIDGLAALPGRKTAVFFAEGLSLPPRVLSRFDSVVATANRANVSVYTMDAAGLRVHSTTAETAQRVRDLAGYGFGETQRLDSNAWTKDLELNEDILRRDPAVSLRLLAERTGGFLIDNTNDLERGFRQIDADRRFHYLLSYTPKNSTFNGEWRNVTVTVPGRTVTIRARSGYLAVRASGAIPLLAYEGPALAALERTPAPADISVRAVAHVFPGAPEPRLTVLATTRGTELTFARDDKTGTYRADFTVLARIRNSAGEVVRKASQPYRLSGPIAQADGAQQGDVLFFRQPTLAPGTYTLDVAVHDGLAGRAGVHTSTFTVPSANELNVSSLVIVQRGEKVPAAEQTADNPLYVGDVLIYPTVGEPVRKADKAVTLFFVIQPPNGAAPTATLEVVRAGHSLATLPLTLDKPDASGRVRQLAQLATAALQPGAYVLRLSVAHGAHREVREAEFTLTD